MSSSYVAGGKNANDGRSNREQPPEDPTVTAWLAALWAKPFTPQQYDEMLAIAANRQIRDTSDMHSEQFYKARKAEVREWICADDESSEMHMVMDVIGSPLPVIMIFRTPEEADRLIRAMAWVRDAVWPKGGG